MKDFRQAELMLKAKVAICLQNLQEQEKMSKKLEEAQQFDGREMSLTGYANKQLLE